MNKPEREGIKRQLLNKSHLPHGRLLVMTVLTALFILLFDSPWPGLIVGSILVLFSVSERHIQGLLSIMNYRMPKNGMN